MRAMITRDRFASTESRTLSWKSFPLIIDSQPPDKHAPLTWWRTRRPNQFCKKDAASVRLALAGTRIESEMRWQDAATGDCEDDAASAIGICVRQIKQHPINADEVDLAVSATLAYALLGDPASAVLLSWALKHRAKIDPCCDLLSDLWLVAEF